MDNTGWGREERGFLSLAPGDYFSKVILENRFPCFASAWKLDLETLCLKE